jgi:hypothetical protein
MMEENRFLNQLSIDEHDLDQELLKQPQLYYEWAKKATEAECDMKDAKDDLEIIKAKIDTRVRKNKEKYKVTTEPSIKSFVETHKKVLTYKKRYIEKRRTALLLEKAERAFDQRKRMLEMYVYRSVHNMNSSVRIPKEKSDEINKNLRRGMKKQLKGALKNR